MRHDQEPDVEEVDEAWAGNCCERCGLKGHPSAACPHVNLMTMKLSDQRQPHARP